MSKICIVCGEEFTPESNRQMFCSEQCRCKARNVNELEDGYWVKTCRLCGNEYKLPISLKANGTKYCSDRCKSLAAEIRNEERNERRRIQNNCKTSIKNLEKAVKKTKGMNYGEFYKPEVKVIFPSWVVPTRRGVNNG